MQLIDISALGIGKCNPDVFVNKSYADGWNAVIELLDNAPRFLVNPLDKGKSNNKVSKSESTDTNLNKFNLSLSADDLDCIINALRKYIILVDDKTEHDNIVRLEENLCAIKTILN